MGKLALTGGEKTIKGSETVIAVDKMLIGRGQGVTKFDRKFAEYVNAKYALLVGSGTDALISGLAAAGVGPGDEVLTVSFTFLASIDSILNVNAIPIFVDIDPKTFTMDIENVERKITERTKAILPVDIYGHPVPIPKLKSIAKKHDLILIEDACQAAGATINEKPLGGLADITAFSFTGKPITSSSGGILTTNNRDYYERALLVGQHPLVQNKIIKNPGLRKYIPTGGFGFNFRPDKSCLSQAFEELEKLDERNEHRIKNAEFLNEQLKEFEGVIATPYVAPNCKHVYHYYTCLYNEKETGIPRDKFIKALQAEGVVLTCYMTHCNYPVQEGNPVEAAPLHYGAIFQELNLYGKGCPFKCPYGKTPNYKKCFLPVTEDIAKREFNIPQNILMEDISLMEQYAKAFKKVMSNLNELREYKGPKEYTFFK